MYYAAFWSEEGGDYIGRRSVGSLLAELPVRIPATPTSKAGARAIVEAWLADHAPGHRSSPILAVDYLDEFWTEGGDYATGKTARGKGLSSQYLYNNRAWIKKYVRPYLEGQGRKITLGRLTAAHIEGLAMHLYSLELSTKTANGIMAAVSSALAEAERLGKIRDNPARRVERLAEEDYIRQPLSIAECRAFFGITWIDPRLLAVNLRGATTGMRLGEVRGLQAEDILSDAIHVCHNWQDREGLKGPKGSKGANIKERFVPLPGKTREVITQLADRNPWGDGFAIFGDVRERPISARLIQTSYNAALAAIGIDDQARTARGLGFHAWRHWYNSQLRGQVPDHALRALTGHHSEAMTDLYTEITAEQRAAVMLLAEGLVG
jgi:integrase